MSKDHLQNASETFLLTAAEIKRNTGSWCDALKGCKPGDRVIWSNVLPGLQDIEPFPVGAARLIAWLDQAEDERTARKSRQAIQAIS